MELDFKLTRSKKNPILTPTNRDWENKLVFNPGVIQLGGKTHLLYRAHGDDGIARLGYARLKNIDEVEERLTNPVFFPEEWFESEGVEDPRLVAIDGMTWESKNEFTIRKGGMRHTKVADQWYHIGYPSVTQLKDGTIIAGYHEYSDDEPTIQFMACARFTL